MLYLTKEKDMKKLFVSLILTASVIQGCSDLGNKTTPSSEIKKETSLYIVDKSDVLQSGELIKDLPKEKIDDKEKTGLLLMREEEKLAKDVYITLYKKWNQRIFNNISLSEQTHMDAVAELLERYSIEDPVKDNDIGVFNSEDLQNLYNVLVELGNKSLVDALKVGATIEDLDIKDLDELLETTDNSDIKVVYENLIKGSRNHLRSFVSFIESQNETYTPKYITTEKYQNIISSKQEKGIIGIK